MHKLYISVSLLTIIIASVFLAGCGDDDKETTQVFPEDFTGTWQMFAKYEVGGTEYDATHDANIIISLTQSENETHFSETRGTIQNEGIARWEESNGIEYLLLNYEDNSSTSFEITEYNDNRCVAICEEAGIEYCYIFARGTGIFGTVSDRNNGIITDRLISLSDEYGFEISPDTQSDEHGTFYFPEVSLEQYPILVRYWGRNNNQITWMIQEAEDNQHFGDLIVY